MVLSYCFEFCTQYRLQKDFSLTKNTGVKLHYMSERSHVLEHRMNAELILLLSRILLAMMQSLHITS